VADSDPGVKRMLARKAEWACEQLGAT